MKKVRQNPEKTCSEGWMSDKSTEHSLMVTDSEFSQMPLKLRKRQELTGTVRAAPWQIDASFHVGQSTVGSPVSASPRGSCSLTAVPGPKPGSQGRSLGRAGSRRPGLPRGGRGCHWRSHPCMRNWGL